MPVPKTVLLIDDDDALRDSLSEQLDLHEEFATTAVKSGDSALRIAKKQNFDAILLELGLPDFDGREVCRQLRIAGVKTPIIMLAAKDAAADAIRMLESGASDYVTKPFRLGVLVARLRAHLRQYEQSEDAIFRVSRYLFRPSARLLVDPDSGEKVRLTEKETAILRYLYRAGACMVNRETLLSEVWGYNSGVTTHTLETHVYRLRQKMERDPSAVEILVTEPGGYRLVP